MTNGNDTAFPSNCEDDTDGLTKREYFAAMAMQGFLSDGSQDLAPEQCARAGVRHADALIAALNEGQ